MTGLLVEPEQVNALSSAISLLLEKPELRERFGASARLHAQHEFAWEPLITKLEQTYQSVIEQQSARRYDQTAL